MGVADPFWWLPFSIWHTILFVVAGFIARRYWSRPESSPFVFGQILGGIVLLGWILTLALISGLDYLAHPSGFILERVLTQLLSWSGFRYLTAIFAGNVFYASVMQGAARHFAIEAHNSNRRGFLDSNI